MTCLARAGVAAALAAAGRLGDAAGPVAPTGGVRGAVEGAGVVRLAGAGTRRGAVRLEFCRAG